MREIKFRVWDKELKEAYIEKLQDLCEDNYWYDGETEIWSVLADCNDEQERFVALQYTGLKDKNGKEIYEGDILKFSDEDTAIVKWDEKYGYFMVKPIQDYHFDSDVLGHVMKYNEVKVIGNIYNNPDLLEGQEINIQNKKEQQYETSKAKTMDKKYLKI